MRVSSAGSALIVIVSEYRKRCGPAVGQRPRLHRVRTGDSTTNRKHRDTKADERIEPAGQTRNRQEGMSLAVGDRDLRGGVMPRRGYVERAPVEAPHHPEAPMGSNPRPSSNT